MGTVAVVKRFTLALAVAAVMAVAPAAAWAAPPPQVMAPSLAVAPTSVAPGDAVRVSASGLGGRPQAAMTVCIGFLGPGQNLELGISPRFQVRLGTLAVGADGMGAAQVRVPVAAAAGVYRVTVGGCPPQAGLAPLAWVAEASLTVTRSGVGGLPATGGGARGPDPRVPAGVVLLAVLGAGKAVRPKRARLP